MHALLLPSRACFWSAAPIPFPQVATPATTATQAAHEWKRNSRPGCRRENRRCLPRIVPFGRRADPYSFPPIAGPDGAFRLPALRPGAYTLRVTFLGFAPTLQEFAITAGAPIVNIGVVRLSRVAVSLSAVAVTEDRATVTIEADRNAYRAKDIAPAAANASELLDHVPSVQVDGDGKVSFREMRTSSSRSTVARHR